jgi:hypothetical protein
MAAVLDFQNILSQIKTGIATLAKATVSNYLNDAKKDGQALLDLIKQDLERWTKLLLNGDLTTVDFEWLVNSQKDSIKMEALKQAGLALIRVDQFKNSIFNLVVDTVFKALKI